MGELQLGHFLNSLKQPFKTGFLNHFKGVFSKIHPLNFGFNLIVLQVLFFAAFCRHLPLKRIPGPAAEKHLCCLMLPPPGFLVQMAACDPPDKNIYSLLTI